MNEEDRYKQLAAKIFMGDSRLIPKLFEAIASPEETDILLSLPGTAQSVSEKFGMDEAGAGETLDTLFRKGLVFKKKAPDGTIFRMCRDLMQFHDASILWPEAPRSFLDLWQEFMEEEWPTFSETVEKLLPRPVTRILPVSESVDTRQQILAYDDVRKMIDDADVIAVTNCTCRLTAQKCDRPVEICMQLGKAGSYSIERGTGRQVDKDEAVQLLKKAEEAGLIHVTMNRAADTHFICNCCNDCCMTFPMLINRQLKMCDPSRFAARIDASLCDSCGECLERCYFGALSMEDESTGAVVKAEACMGCGLCQVVCPNGAIVLETVRETDFIPT
ncbi:MAG TPA: 4Fe-4S binding protein [Candidatus Anoxymicrobiaceae bacterium]